MNQGNTIFLFMGPPGSGKGTLSLKCIKEFGWQQLSTGNLCRAHVVENTAIGIKMKEILNQGKLVPDEMIAEMVKDWILSIKDKGSNIIFDGYPRTKKQAELLWEILKKDLQGYKILVVQLQVDTDLLVNRIVSRLFCSNKDCQQVYSLMDGSQAKPKIAMMCDTCSCSLMRRSDDTAETLKNRIGLYQQHEKDIIDFAREHGSTMLTLDGMQTVDDVFEKFKTLIEQV